MLIHLTNGALFYAAGKVVHGFGRGSKQLGIPTGLLYVIINFFPAYIANLEEFIVDQIPDSVKNGIYFGWAKLNNTPVYKMVMSIGWNPYFKNAKRSMEVHILHHFEENFYGDTIKLIAVKFSRPELDFPSISKFVYLSSCMSAGGGVSNRINKFKIKFRTAYVNLGRADMNPAPRDQADNA
ncbi:Riboflavin kinase isoform 4 [Schistosoma japonicum]|uniref:riboflavin kinase n=2 Tax=Schistosoma japonicum TaxID=6182 RepID=A0A4Z2CV19_SCHJA|nr:Riboflavin kinase [Schistosoma japonicum]KAH8857967.1 Riboflavin kinase [Schistosoma japonicum]TNN08101.1 Riboflavin kinase isoform 4 [Schistosoma japonicum]